MLHLVRLVFGLVVGLSVRFLVLSVFLKQQIFSQLGLLLVQIVLFCPPALFVVQRFLEVLLILGAYLLGVLIGYYLPACLLALLLYLVRIVVEMQELIDIRPQEFISFHFKEFALGLNLPHSSLILASIV